MIGSGTLGDPYIITTVQDLQNVNNDLDAYYVLGNDIDCTDFDFIPIGIINNVKNEFNGNFNGRGHKIINLTIETDYNKDIGLFAYPVNATIKNIIFENSDITTSSYEEVGTVAGYVYNSNISNVKIYNGTVISKNHAGGFIGAGYFDDGTYEIKDCYFQGYIKCTYEGLINIIGGFADYLGTDISASLTVKCCRVEGFCINDKPLGTGGGFIGKIEAYDTSNLIIEDCEANLDLNINDTSQDSAGFIGDSYGSSNAKPKIKRCSAYGNVRGNDTCAGFVAHAYYTDFEDCYTIGNTFGNIRDYAYFGGFVAYSSYSTFQNCYSTGKTGTYSSTYPYVEVTDEPYKQDWEYRRGKDCGLLFQGNYLYLQTRHKIYKIDISDMSIADSVEDSEFPESQTFPPNSTFDGNWDTDGTYLYVVVQGFGQGFCKLYKVLLSDLTATYMLTLNDVRTIKYANGYLYYLGYDYYSSHQLIKIVGTNTIFWKPSNTNQKHKDPDVYCNGYFYSILDNRDGRISKQKLIPGDGFTYAESEESYDRLACYGGYVYAYNGINLVKLSPDDLSIISFFPLDCEDFWIYAGYIFAQKENKIYKIDFNGNILSSWTSNYDTFSTAFDGTYLYIAYYEEDKGKIRVDKINIETMFNGEPGSAGGGFCGWEEYSTATSCYWDTETSGTETSALGTGKTTAQMKTESTFVDWDFKNVWRIEEDITYPYLKNQCSETTKKIMSFIQFQRQLKNCC